MTAKEYRHTAWGKLSGQWGTMALSTLLISLIEGLATSLVGVGLFIVGGPFGYAAAEMSLNISRGKTEKFENIFNGFKKDFGGTVVAFLLMYLFEMLWSLLFFIPGIIASYSYALTYYIMVDNPGMSGNDARKRSIELMKGNKWRLFCLQLSFLGWALLNVLTCGILSYWIVPYQNVAIAEFYRELIVEPTAAPATNDGADATNAGARTCPNCGSANASDAAFCTKCGTLIPTPTTRPATAPSMAQPTLKCTNCGAVNDADAAFCTSCGAKLK